MILAFKTKVTENKITFFDHQTWSHGYGNHRHRPNTNIEANNNTNKQKVNGPLDSRLYIYHHHHHHFSPYNHSDCNETLRVVDFNLSELLCNFTVFIPHEFPNLGYLRSSVTILVLFYSIEFVILSKSFESLTTFTVVVHPVHIPVYKGEKIRLIPGT